MTQPNLVVPGKIKIYEEKNFHLYHNLKIQNKKNHKPCTIFNKSGTLIWIESQLRLVKFNLCQAGARIDLVGQAYMTLYMQSSPPKFITANNIATGYLNSPVIFLISPSLHLHLCQQQIQLEQTRTGPPSLDLSPISRLQKFVSNVVLGKTLNIIQPNLSVNLEVA